MRIFRLLKFCFVCMAFLFILPWNVFAIQWEKTFGGSNGDSAQSVQQTTDGGYIIAGSTGSFGAGGSDVYLIKTGGNGNKQWEKTFGGSNDDVGRSVQQAIDGGYIIAGFTASFGAGGDDFYLIKTDGNGNKQWEKTYAAGSALDIGLSVQQTIDGGYIITGWADLKGAYLYLIKTDGNGELQWEKTFGPPHINGFSVQQTTDGGYIIAGSAWPLGTYNYWDFYLIKTDANGDKQWEKILGGSNDDRGYSGQQTTDGGYIIAGSTGPWGGSDYDFYLIKTDANGDKQWEKTFGGSNDDFAYSVQQTNDGGYIIAGKTGSFGEGGSDGYLIKTDGNGNKQWEKTFGGSNGDSAWSVQQTTDGGYIIAGSTGSFGAGSSDVYLIYYNPEVLIDSDNDGLPDDIENASCTDPNNADSDDDSIPDGVEDKNQNGAFDDGETNPCDPDTDNDQMPDGWEVSYGLNPLVDDANDDLDVDGYTNIEEYREGSDPRDKNSIPKPKPKAMPWIPLLLDD